jgi:L-serine kinase (ATP) / ParB family transcriptional regulator, heme-responsive regulator
MQTCSLEEARQAIETKEALAYIVCQSEVRKVLCPQGCESRDLQFLGDLVKTYKGRADIFRASNDIWEKQAPFYPEITALMIFPRLRPEDILFAAQNGYKIPSGITRHIIPFRALNINIPLQVLRADWTLERKREWLQQWLMERMAANAIRYYEESTFSFNE